VYLKVAAKGLINAPCYRSRNAISPEKCQLFRFNRGRLNQQNNYSYSGILAEQGRKGEAKTALRTALDIDPQLAPAAYNLGVMLARDRIEEAVELCRKAS